MFKIYVIRVYKCRFVEFCQRPYRSSVRLCMYTTQNAMQTESDDSIFGTKNKNSFCWFPNRNWCVSIKNTIFRLQQVCSWLYHFVKCIYLRSTSVWIVPCFYRKMLHKTTYDDNIHIFTQIFSHSRQCSNSFNSFILISTWSVCLSHAIHRISRSLILFR